MAAVKKTTRAKAVRKAKAKRQDVTAEFMKAMGQAVEVAEERVPPARVHVVRVTVPAVVGPMDCFASLAMTGFGRPERIGL